MSTQKIVSGIALSSAILLGGTAHAGNPFEAKCLGEGYKNTAECTNANKKAEGKCGEGKCGGADKSTKSGKKAEAKCGEGKCGS